jgi:hypothetical protein
VLYRREAFEPLTDDPWDERRARRAIDEIVADAEAAFRLDELWPAHEWDAWSAPVPLQNLYVGAAGVIWALDVLRRRGYAETRLDLAAAAARTLDAWREAPDFATAVELPAERDAALLTGETGILLVAWRLEPSRERADALLARVLQNVRSEAGDLMWGVPGTLLAARAMLDWTGEERWADAWRESAEALWRRRDPEGWWTQRLYGSSYRGLAPPHGLVGNVQALLAGGELLDEERREALTRDTGALLAATVVAEGKLANWPLVAGAGLLADGEIRVQWCAGAPGIVIAASSYLDEELLRAGGELAWRAGPPGLEKGAGICHGTAGNGYAFLKLFERTGDELWLVRARSFAMHALGQVTRRGSGRYSLWTGDAGVALYAAACLEGESAYPVLDGF